MATLYEEMVDAIDGVSGGPHPGHRAAHARGSMCRGTFVATPRAGELSRAGHLTGAPVPVTARFSNGSGNPSLPDNLRTEGRGLAVKFHLDGDRSVDSVTLTIPVFFVRTPEDFLEFTRARKPDPETGQPDPEKLGALLAEHPETGAALQLILPSLVPPASYATCAYNSLHAFGLISADERVTWVKLRWEPEAGEQALAEEEIESAADDYLQADLRERIAGEPVRFRLVAAIGHEEDPLEDPTLPWPDDRERVELGALELTEALPPEKPGELNVFDPMNLVDGIVPSDDRILHARTHAYSVSIDRRLANP
jgi:catalase